MTKLKPAPEGQPTSSVIRFLEHARNDLADWEQELALLKRQTATTERVIAREKENVKLYEYQLALRLEQGRND